MIPFYPNTGSDDPLAFALAFAMDGLDGPFPTGYPHPASPVPRAPKNELNKKWTYFRHKMALNPFSLNKGASKPRSNFVKFGQISSILCTKQPLFVPKSPQNAPFILAASVAPSTVQARWQANSRPSP
jgi:hypothetical protein